MDWWNKLVCVKVRGVLASLGVLLIMAAGGLGQSYPYHSSYYSPYQSRPQSDWGGQQYHQNSPPSPHYQQQSSPFAPVVPQGPAGAVSVPYYGRSPSAPVIQSRPATHYPSNDRFYVHNRQRLPQSSAQAPVYSSPQLDAYYSSPSYYSHSSTSPTGGSSAMGQPYRYPGSETYHSPTASNFIPSQQYSQVKYSRYPTRHAARPPRPSPFGGSSNTETYREAMDLFAEVIRKMGKEARSVSGLRNAAKFFLSNGIYGGSSSSLSPQYLDHVMGPEFLHRARKLYNKIIKEQNQRLARQRQEVADDNEVPPSFSRDHGGGYEGDNVISAGSYERPSYYSRNMVVGPSSAPVPLDAVKSLEVWTDGGTSQQHSLSGEEMMQTAESAAPTSPIFSGDAPVGEGSYANISPVVQQVSGPSVAEGNYVISPVVRQESAPGPKITPLNENDFIEHPLPYLEYEGFVRDIVQNHDYSKK